MTYDEILIAILFVGIILLIKCYMDNKTEGFSLSNKPMETENTLLHRNPFDDIDYVTPTFTMLKR